MSGLVSHCAGLAAEHQVEAHYDRAGCKVTARRWRGKYGGEIDLIATEGDVVIFIEVKRARSHALAAERLSARQMHRIFLSAEEFVARHGDHANLNMRFDVALVDEAGRIEIIPNACFFD